MCTIIGKEGEILYKSTTITIPHMDSLESMMSTAIISFTSPKHETTSVKVKEFMFVSEFFCYPVYEKISNDFLSLGTRALKTSDATFPYEELFLFLPDHEEGMPGIMNLAREKMIASAQKASQKAVAITGYRTAAL